MTIQGTGIAGTLESSDITISIEKNDKKGVDIQLKSTVENQFGGQIRQVIREQLQELGVEDVVVRANDKGALDCTIKARVTAAVRRVSADVRQPWEAK